MKRIGLVLVTWLLAGVGAVGVSAITGVSGSQRWLFAGALLGGALGTVATVALATRFRLIAPSQVRGAVIGGLLGFGIATPVAVSNLHSPVVPVLSTSLAGFGSLLGALCFADRQTFVSLVDMLARKHGHVAVAGYLSLLPAFVLVSTGLLDLEPPTALVHPVLVMGGVFTALALNTLSVFRIHVGRDDDSLRAAISLHYRYRIMNLTALMVAGFLLATITAYLFVENFQPR